MLVPAMAFAWCVISAEAGHASASHSGPDAAAAARRSKVALGATAAQPSAVAGERTKIRGPIPAEVIAYAKTMVSLPMGTEEVAEIGGQRYVFVLERHYHPPGFVGAPNGWHKGVTAYELH